LRRNALRLLRPTRRCGLLTDNVDAPRSDAAVGRNKRSALRRCVSNRLAEVARSRGVACPIPGKQLRPHVAVERRMRPTADPGHQAVLDPVDVTILDVAAEILIVADQVFPEPTLPDASFAARKAHRASPLDVGNRLGKSI
jgi:hypothetical protein